MVSFNTGGNPWDLNIEKMNPILFGSQTIPIPLIDQASGNNISAQIGSKIGWLSPIRRFQETGLISPSNREPWPNSIRPSVGMVDAVAGLVHRGAVRQVAHIIHKQGAGQGGTSSGRKLES